MVPVDSVRWTDRSCTSISLCTVFTVSQHHLLVHLQVLYLRPRDTVPLTMSAFKFVKSQGSASRRTWHIFSHLTVESRTSIDCSCIRTWSLKLEGPRSLHRFWSYDALLPGTRGLPEASPARVNVVPCCAARSAIAQGYYRLSVN